MPNPWFKFYASEYLSDPKMLALTGNERSCWLTLLCLANMTNGVVEYLTEERLMNMAGLDFTRDEWNDTMGVLAKFTKLGMVTVSNENVTIINWEKRQASESLERVRRFRTRRKVTIRNMRREKRRREEKRREDLLFHLNSQKQDLINKKSI